MALNTIEQRKTLSLEFWGFPFEWAFENIKALKRRTDNAMAIMKQNKKRNTKQSTNHYKLDFIWFKQQPR